MLELLAHSKSTSINKSRYLNHFLLLHNSTDVIMSSFTYPKYTAPLQTGKDERSFSAAVMLVLGYPSERPGSEGRRD